MQVEYQVMWYFFPNKFHY